MSLNEVAFEPGVELNEFFFFWGGCFVFVFLSSIKGNKDLFIDQHVLRAFYQQYFRQWKTRKKPFVLQSIFGEVTCIQTHEKSQMSFKECRNIHTAKTACLEISQIILKI